MSRRRTGAPSISLFSFQDIITSVMGIVVLILLVLALELVNREFQSPPSQTNLVKRRLEEDVDALRADILALRERLGEGNLEELGALSPAQVARESFDLQTQIESLKKQLSWDQHSLVALQKRLSTDEERLAARIADRLALEAARRKIDELTARRTRLAKGNRLFYNPQPSTKSPWILEVCDIDFQVARIGVVSPPLRFDSTNLDIRIRSFFAWADTRNPDDEFFVVLLKPNAVHQFDELEKGLRKRGFDLGLDLIGPKQTALDSEVGAGF